MQAFNQLFSAPSQNVDVEYIPYDTENFGDVPPEGMIISFDAPQVTHVEPLTWTDRVAQQVRFHVF